MPKGVQEALDEILRVEGLNADHAADRAMGVEAMGPFVSKRLGIYNGEYCVQVPPVALL